MLLFNTFKLKQEIFWWDTCQVQSIYKRYDINFMFMINYKFYTRNNFILISYSNLPSLAKKGIYPKPTLWAGCDTKSIWRGVKLVWIQHFPSPRLVASSKLMNSVHFLHIGGREQKSFLRALMHAKWSAINLV